MLYAIGGNGIITRTVISDEIRAELSVLLMEFVATVAIQAY